MTAPGQEEAVAWVREGLFARADEGYRAFNSSLIPAVSPERVIGVRMPALRSFAEEVASSGRAGAYLASLPHRYLEEDHLHGLLLNRERDCTQAVRLLDAFLPHVDNWQTCDLLKPSAFEALPEGLLDRAYTWMGSGRVYTVRFGVSVLMNFYLDGDFSTEQLDAAASLGDGDYYVEMEVAWYFATALAKRWDETLPYLEEGRLAPTTRARTIRKACESFRIPAERKDELRAMR